jgi:hypothetical protein
MDRKIVFLDIETVPAWGSYDDVPAGIKNHWLKKPSVCTQISKEAKKIPRLTFFTAKGLAYTQNLAR